MQSSLSGNHKAPLPEKFRQRRLTRYHSGLSLSRQGIRIGTEKPLSTMGQGRIRGTTLHYTFVLSVTETAAFSTRFQSGAPGRVRLMPHTGFHHPPALCHGLHETLSRSSHLGRSIVCFPEVECNHTGSIPFLSMTFFYYPNFVYIPSCMSQIDSCCHRCIHLRQSRRISILNPFSVCRLPACL